ncbi:hypothetical protein ACIBCN_18950 [Nocardia sp. NPDC051052]|uniref:hypothetical protein n=1 Tax=Nocardia sp. NPDC051052 TaxID=3364322 RepID=UPI0037A56424
MIDDPTFRDLSPAGQHLMLLLGELVHEQTPTRHAGVLAWRPERVAQLANGWTTEQVTTAAAELESAGMVLIDTDERELWLARHIGAGLAVRSPKMRPAVAKAVAVIRSPRLRAAAVEVLAGLVAADPAGWVHPAVVAVVGPVPDASADTVSGTVLDTLSKTVIPEDHLRGVSPLGDTPRKDSKKTTNVVFLHGSHHGDRNSMPPSTLTGFEPSMKAKRWAAQACPSVDVTAATTEWRNYNLATGRIHADPERAWYGWMRRAQQIAQDRAAFVRSTPRAHLAPTPMPPPASQLLAQAGAATASTSHRREMMDQIRRTISGFPA